MWLRRIAEIQWNIAKIILSGVVILFVIYGIFTIISNFQDVVAKPPSIEKAQWGLTIVNTNQTIFTNDFEFHDTVYIPHGFWAEDKRGFIYHKGDIILDEKVFGPIIPSRRTK